MESIATKNILQSLQEKEKQISCLENRIQTFVASPLSIE